MTNLKTKATTLITRLFKNRGYWWVTRKDFDVIFVEIDVYDGETIISIRGVWSNSKNKNLNSTFAYYKEADILHISKLEDESDADNNV